MEKLRANYFQVFVQFGLGVLIGMFPLSMLAYYTNDASTDHSKEIMIMLIIIAISAMLIILAILKIFRDYVLISDDKIIIHSTFKRKEVRIKDIVRIEKEFKRGRDTPLFGRDTYKILTNTKTYKVTSEQYKGLDKLLTII